MTKFVVGRGLSPSKEKHKHLMRAAGAKFLIDIQASLFYFFNF